MSSQMGNDGSYTLTVTFDIGTDLNTALVMVQNRVTLAMPHLPTSVQNQGITIRKKTPDILMVVNFFSPDGRYDDIYLSNYRHHLHQGRAPPRAGRLGHQLSGPARLQHPRLARPAEAGVARHDRPWTWPRRSATRTSSRAAGQIGQPPAPPGQAPDADRHPGPADRTRAVRRNHRQGRAGDRSQSWPRRASPGPRASPRAGPPNAIGFSRAEPWQTQTNSPDLGRRPAERATTTGGPGIAATDHQGRCTRLGRRSAVAGSPATSNQSRRRSPRPGPRASFPAGGTTGGGQPPGAGAARRRRRPRAAAAPTYRGSDTDRHGWHQVQSGARTAALASAARWARAVVRRARRPARRPEPDRLSSSACATWPGSSWRRRTTTSPAPSTASRPSAWPSTSFPGTNALDVADRVKRKMEELKTRFPRRRRLRHPLRHHAVHPRVGRGGGQDPARGRRPGRRSWCSSSCRTGGRC